jgi:hypothetical protein
MGITHDGDLGNWPIARQNPQSPKMNVELPMRLPDQWNLPQAARITSLQNTPSPIS